MDVVIDSISGSRSEWESAALKRLAAARFRPWPPRTSIAYRDSKSQFRSVSFQERWSAEAHISDETITHLASCPSRKPALVGAWRRRSLGRPRHYR